MCARHFRLASELLLIPPLLHNHCILRNEKDLKQMAIKNRKFNYHKQERPGRQRTIVSCRNDSRLFRAVEWREQVADNTLNSDQGFWSLWKNSKTILGKIEDCTHTFYRIHSEGSLKLLINKRKALVVAGYKKLDRQRPYRSLPSLEVPSFLEAVQTEGMRRGKNNRIFSLTIRSKIEVSSDKRMRRRGKQFEFSRWWWGCGNETESQTKTRCTEAGREERSTRDKCRAPRKEKTWTKPPKREEQRETSERESNLKKTKKTEQIVQIPELALTTSTTSKPQSPPPAKPHNNNPTAFHKSSFLETQTPAPTKKKKTKIKEKNKRTTKLTHSPW